MKTIYLTIIALLMFGLYGQAQCPAPFAVNGSACSGISKPISAQSFFGSGVTSHRWYTTPTGNTQVSGVVQNTAPGSGYYISTLTRSHTATTTYYVAPVCGSTVGSRIPVKFTVTSGSNISIGVSGGTQPTYCLGETVTLTASGGSNYQWRRGSATSTVLGTGTSFPTTTSGTYYLTGRNGCGQTQTRSINLTFDQPDAPSSSRINVAENCGSTTISLNPPSGEVWYWQSSASGTSQTNFQTSRIFTSVTPIYIRSRFDLTDCWGPAVQVNYNVRAVPDVPTTPNVAPSCGSTVLTKGNAPSGVTWYWQSSATGTSTSSSAAAQSITRTSGSIYYLRARNNSSGCWSAARTVNYTINTVPNTPASPTITNNCGNTMLTKGSAPSGITWYWQGSATGTSTSGSAAAQSVTRTSGSVYYLRARNNSTGCWSTARAVNYSVNPVPQTPTSPNGDSRVGSGIVNLSATVGSGGNTIRWYDVASGGNVLHTGPNFSPTINTAGITTFYAESYNTNTQCKSTNRLAVNAVMTLPDPPPAPLGVGRSACSTGIYILTARSEDDVESHVWYTTQTGTTEVSGIEQDVALTGVPYYISRLEKNFTGDESYWVSAVRNGVESTQRTEVAFTLNTGDNLSIQVITGPKPQYCPGETVTLEAINGTGNYRWTKDSPTGTLVGTGPTYSPNETGEYHVTADTNCGEQQSRWIQVNFADLSEPPLPVVEETCGITTITRDDPVDGSGEIWHWQTTADGEDQSAASTAKTRTFSAVEPLFLRKRIEFTDCWGPATQVTFTVRQAPAPPTASNHTQCGNDPYDLYADIGTDADIIYWYDVPTGGTPLDEGTFYRVNMAVNGTTSYFVESYNSTTGCRSLTRTEIQATVLAGETPTAPWGQSVYFCEEGTVTLTVTQPSNVDEIRWYDEQNGGNQVGTGPTFTTPIINESTTYYVEGVNTTYGCISNFRRAIFAIRNSEIVWYLDEDQDGLGDPANATALTCEQPQGYVGNNNDLCPEIYSPSNDCSSNPLDQNYVYSRVYQTRSDTIIDPVFFTQNDHLIQNITYFDGLGRSLQKISIGQSPERNDIVTLIEYNGFGRIKNEWLPYPTTDGQLASFRLSPKGQTLQYYNQLKYENTENPYLEKDFEIGPLNRIKKQAAPGNDWALGQGHEMEFDYETNTAADAIKQFEVNTTLDETNEVITHLTNLLENGEYGSGELYKNITKDENHSGTGKNHTTEEFTNKQGQVVLKRTYNANQAHDTYYVYDDFGNLTYVIPPKVDTSDGVSVSELTELCYQYIYDHRNRLVEKKLPGKGWEYIVYNKLDQPIMTQDANQRTKQTTSDEWLFTKYDAFGRVAYTGKATAAENTSRTAIQNEVDNSSSALWVARGNEINVGNADISYNDGAYPNSSSNAQLSEILTINYYDDYYFDRSGTGTSHVAFGITTTSEVKGLPTGTKVKVLDVSGTNVWITTVTFYDEKARPIYTYSHNDYLGTVDIVSSQLDFVGKPRKVRSSHRKAGTTIVTLDNFTYDHTGRLLTQTQCIGDDTLGNSCDGVVDGCGTEVNAVINDPIVDTSQVAISSITLSATPGQSVILRPGSGGTTVTLRIDPNAAPGGGSGSGNTATSAEELIVSKTYDALGQLESKMVGGDPTGNGLQTVDYSYNVRGWLKQINNPASLGNDLFAFGINYNTVNHSGTPLFNGNIAETEWRTANTDNSLKWYNYSYDALNRIVSATDNTNKYSLSGVTYDKNGNINTLLRQGWITENPLLANNTGFGVMDNLTYTYNGNQLQKVADAATLDQYGFKDDAINTTVDTLDDYTYDANGNTISDDNKGITNISYNHLNLPTQVTLIDGTISYIYDAAGVKLKKVVNNATESSLNTTEYAGNFIYEDNNLQFFNTAEGYVQKNSNGGFDYVYQYKDHLGNVRLSYTDDPSNRGTPTIIEESNYYPFGLKHKGYNTGGDNSLGNDLAQKWKYNGKELQDELGLDMYDYGARNYDPALGRWFGIDELAENYSSSSPYAFVGNNPMTNLEIDGRFWIRTVDENGNITYTAEQGDSAYSLFEQFGEQDGFNAEDADFIIQHVFGENRVEDGEEFSNIDPDDSFTLFSEDAEVVEGDHTFIVVPDDSDIEEGSTDEMNFGSIQKDQATLKAEDDLKALVMMAELADPLKRKSKPLKRGLKALKLKGRKTSKFTYGSKIEFASKQRLKVQAGKIRAQKKIRQKKLKKRLKRKARKKRSGRF
jgi:RHS repeat-associated protein